MDWSHFWADLFSWRPSASRLEDAISSGNLEKVRAVLDGAPHRGIPKEILVGVIMERRDEILRLFVERGVALDQPLEWGGTALHIAARYGSPEAVRLVLSRGVDINMDGDGTPLYWAADRWGTATVDDGEGPQDIRTVRMSWLCPRRNRSLLRSVSETANGG